jgi:hypothetical protein
MNNDLFSEPFDGLDAWIADKILAGAVAADDAPPGYAPVVMTLDVLRRPATNSGPAPSMPDTLMAQLAAAQCERRRNHRAIALVAAATVAVLALSTGLAAANVLPRAAQRFASDTLAHLGVHVPHPDDTRDTARTGANPAATIRSPARSSADHGTTGNGVSGNTSNGTNQTSPPSRVTTSTAAPSTTSRAGTVHPAQPATSSTSATPREPSTPTHPTPQTTRPTPTSTPHRP